MTLKKATEVFEAWAKEGKDIGMEKTHEFPVNEMIDFAIKERKKIRKQFSFLDLGCGNGWVVRKVTKNLLCKRSVGIDGANQMILNAKAKGGDAEYILADINSYKSSEKFDVIHSMEVLYYLDKPSKIIKRIVDSWLNRAGRLIIGVDHYYENTESHSWQEKVGTKMHMLKESEWIKIFKASGLSHVESWRSNKGKDWAGTLVISGIKS